MKKLISIMLILTALLASGCGKKAEVEDVKTDAPEVKQEQKAQEKKEAEPKVEQPEDEKSEQKPQAQVEQPKVIETNGENLEEMINKFNELEDGSPEKEKIREQLEAIFASAE